MNSETAELSRGEWIAGRYQIEAELGRGAFGGVYKALDAGTHRHVALKVLHAHRSASARDQKRFAREAALLVGLRHPNVVHVLDCGFTTDAVPFIALEFLSGRTLERVLASDGALEVARVRRIAIGMLAALTAAHELGIVHRDIKPANVFLLDHDEVRVLDFGIAKTLAAEGDLVTKLTATGAILGTPAYMAPEQVRGEGIGAATDLYAVGLLLAELLTGERVMRAPTAIDVLMQHIRPDPVPLSPAVLASPLGPVIERAVRKAPEHRYASAREMLAALPAPSAVAAVPTVAALPPRQPADTPTLLRATRDVTEPALRPPAMPSPRPGAAARPRWAVRRIALGTIGALAAVGAVAALATAAVVGSTSAPEGPSASDLRPPAGPTAEAPATPPRPPSTGTAASEGTAEPGALPFDQAAAASQLSARAEQAQSCARPGSKGGTGSAVVTFAPSGRVTRVLIKGSFAGNSIGACVGALFRTALVPPFSGSSVTVSRSFSIR